MTARIKGILLSPRAEWPVIAAEPDSVAGLYRRYILWIAALPAIAGFLKLSVLGIGVPFVGTVRIGISTGLFNMALQYAVSLGVVYLIALLINALAPTYGGRQDMTQALKTSAYAFTASWVAGVFVLVPWIGGVLGIAGVIYAIYLLAIGLPHTMQCPDDKKLGYTVVTVLAAIVVSFLLSAIVGRITGVGSPSDEKTRIEISRGSDSVSVDSQQLDAWSKRIEEAGKRMEQAQKDGNADAQGKALGDMMGALFGGGGEPVESIASEEIQRFVPETLGKLPRRSINVERNTVMGLQMTEAKARYADDDDNISIDLQIADLGSAKGLATLGGFVTQEVDRRDDNGYERIYREGDRRVQERWDNSSNSGSYSLLIGQRFTVSLEGRGVPMDQLKRYTQSLDLKQLEKLKAAGQSKG